ncbi:MAG TPA: hypothetical protein VFI08_05450 [Spirochaetia bacterium]|nr:hypothetical protein [Spirochaetia bacterium]
MKRAPALIAPLALLLVSCLPSTVRLPQSPALRWLEHRAGRIAYVGLDGNIHTMDQAGGSQTDVTSDAAVNEDSSSSSFFYQFPAWSPDAKSLAFVSIRRTADTLENTAVWTSALDGAAPTRVYTSTERAPRFLSWAPDSSRLVFVTGRPSDAAQLDSVSPRGGEVRVLGAASGFAWRWEKRGRRLAVHSVQESSGMPVGKVGILDPQGEGTTDFAQKPGEFDAPAWSADGTIITAEGDSIGSTLYREDTAGDQRTPLAHFDGSAVFDLSPDGERLAWAASPAVGDTARRALYVLDLSARQNPSASARPAAGPVSGDDYVAAFFWSPDGRRIAYFVPSDTDGSVTMKVVSVESRSVKTVSTFTPSSFFLSVLTEFGQYAESMRLWSPDSRFLLYCTAQGQGFDVMVAYADEAIEPRKVADGLMASWSPR